MENYKVYIPTKKAGTEIKFTISFNKNQYSWATGSKLELGYRVSATPVEISRRENGITMESFSAFSGFTDSLLVCDRRSAKRYEQAKTILKEKMLQYIEFFEKKGFEFWDELKHSLIAEDEDNNYRRHLLLTGI